VPNDESLAFLTDIVPFNTIKILHFLSGVGFTFARRMVGKLDKDAPENTIRESSCPIEYLENLLQPPRREAIM
jgi:hypothetical protein